jgi:quercetin dioxygenase-like cupin family protein
MHVIAAIALIGSALLPAAALAAERSENMEISRNGTRPSAKGPTEYFTGSVRVDPLFEAVEPTRASAALVTFEPGARSAWHTRPLGQKLIVTAGLGWTQEEGGPIEELRPVTWSGAPLT